MQEKIQSAVFQYLTDYFSDYGIPLEFRYDEDLDILEEFRRSMELRINNSNTYENLIEKITVDDNGTAIHNLGLFNRTPIKKSEELANNIKLEVYSQNINTNEKVEIRNAFYGSIFFTVKILCDNYEVCDLIELLYAADFGRQKKTILIDFDLSDDIEPLEEVEYNVMFNDISFIGKINESSLRYLDLDFELSGVFFMPYYKDEYKVKGVDLHLMVAPGEIPVDTTDPIFDITDRKISTTLEPLSKDEMRWVKGTGHPEDTHL